MRVSLLHVFVCLIRISRHDTYYLLESRTSHVLVPTVSSIMHKGFVHERNMRANSDLISILAGPHIFLLFFFLFTRNVSRNLPCTETA